MKNLYDELVQHACRLGYSLGGALGKVCISGLQWESAISEFQVPIAS